MIIYIGSQEDDFTKLNIGKKHQHFGMELVKIASLAIGVSKSTLTQAASRIGRWHGA
jgi:hypothetical protein